MLEATSGGPSPPLMEQDEVQPFRITLELAEPVLVNRSVAFDGLLAHLHFLRTGDAATAHHALPLAEVDGVYQGSELLFLGPVVRRTVPYIMNPRWDRFRHGELVDKHGKPRGKITARDEFKPVGPDYYEAVSARRAFFIGVGDVAAVKTLLRGLDAVGKKARSRGFGRLAGWRIDVLDDAPAEIGYADFGGRPVRVVPLDVWNRLHLPTDDVSIGPARPRLPRWATEDELCTLPASHVIEPHEQHRIGL